MPKLAMGLNELHSCKEIVERASPDGLVVMADSIHAHAYEVDAPAKPIGHGFIDVMRVGGERHGKLSLVRRMLTQLYKTRVERWFAPAKPHSESSTRIKFN